MQVFHRKIGRAVTSATAIALALVAQSGHAQEADATVSDQSVVSPEESSDSDPVEITVTGSRIARSDMVSNSPVNVVGEAEISRTGSAETEQILNSLPQITAGFGSQSNDPGNGTATLNLRNLGSVRTLVLLNGRRVVGATNDGVVDINLIPPALIKRVEVVTGGASAVYGSDAMAGVVNFTLKDDFEGVEMNAQAGVSSRGDSARYNVDFTAGGNFADGKGNITFYANYFKRAETLSGARSYASRYLVDAVVDGKGVLLPGGNAVTPQGTLFSPDLVGLQDQFGNTIGTDGIFFAPEGWRAYNDSDAFNDRVYSTLQLPMERVQAAVNGRYELGSSIEAFWEATYARTKVGAQEAALPMSSSGFISNFQFDTRNPYLPASLRDFLVTNLDQDGDGFVPVNINRRTTEVGLRTTRQTRDFWRFVGGFRGELNSRLKWEAYFNRGENSVVDTQTGGVILDRFANGFVTAPGNPAACASTQAGCVILNPFGAGTLTPEMANYIGTTLTNRNQVTQTQIGATLTGSLFDLPAGPLGFSLGTEYRRESARFDPDNLYTQNNAISRAAGLQPTRGSYNVKEVFGEVYVPILADKPGAELLAFEGGARYSDYSSAGGVFSFKAGGEYSPFRGLKFRGLFQRAVRAPNITELFSGVVNEAPVATDFCNAGPTRTAAERDFCLTLGVPGSVIDVFQQENIVIRTLLGGNPNLRAETSNTWSVGGVYTPSFAPNLQFTVDYYNINIKNAIAAFAGGIGQTIAACRSDLSLSNPFCTPLATRTPDGQLQDVPLLNENIGGITSKGVDWRVDVASIDAGSGRLSYFIAGTYTIENKYTSSPILRPLDCAGYVGTGSSCYSTNPKWRFTQRLTWTSDQFEVSLRHRFIGTARDERITQAISAGDDMPLLAVPKAPNVNYFDLSLSATVTPDVTFYANIDNLLDKDPPYLSDRQTYDYIGRRFTVGVRKSF
ncbi:MAG: TonB-dependent receptor [Sphingopyxis sp.]|nr:TonB-dependent receptor [Sphingopyxis sp.]